MTPTHHHSLDQFAGDNPIAYGLASWGGMHVVAFVTSNAAQGFLSLVVALSAPLVTSIYRDWSQARRDRINEKLAGLVVRAAAAEAERDKLRILLDSLASDPDQV